MSVRWSDLSKDVQKCLLSCLRKQILNNMNSQGVSNSIYGLCKMNVSWYDDLSNDDRIVIANALLRVKDDMNEQHAYSPELFFLIISMLSE